MSRSWIVLCLLAVVLVPGCGDDESDDKPAARTESSQTESAEDEPREAAARRREKREQEEQELERKELEDDRKFDRGFEETPFERVVHRLPIGDPPLFVRQYITEDGHKLYAAVDPGRFCKMPAAGRREAVAAFFRTADRSFRRAKIDDLELSVTPVSETIDELPTLATARRGEVSLASRGC